MSPTGVTELCLKAVLKQSMPTLDSGREPECPDITHSEHSSSLILTKRLNNYYTHSCFSLNVHTRAENMTQGCSWQPRNKSASYLGFGALLPPWFIFVLRWAQEAIEHLKSFQTFRTVPSLVSRIMSAVEVIAGRILETDSRTDSVSDNPWASSDLLRRNINMITFWVRSMWEKNTISNNEKPVMTWTASSWQQKASP